MQTDFQVRNSNFTSIVPTNSNALQAVIFNTFDTSLFLPSTAKFFFQSIFFTNVRNVAKNSKQTLVCTAITTLSLVCTSTHNISPTVIIITIIIIILIIIIPSITKNS